MKEKKPTASTRSNEDFPAFWSPIIVTSISVALHLPDHHMALFLAHLKPQLFFFFFKLESYRIRRFCGERPGEWKAILFAGANNTTTNWPTYQNILKSQS